MDYPRLSAKQTYALALSAFVAWLCGMLNQIDGMFQVIANCTTYSQQVHQS
jgi:hypothetical protein